MIVVIVIVIVVIVIVIMVMGVLLELEQLIWFHVKVVKLHCCLYYFECYQWCLITLFDLNNALKADLSKLGLNFGFIVVLMRWLNS